MEVLYDNTIIFDQDLLTIYNKVTKILGSKKLLYKVLSRAKRPA